MPPRCAQGTAHLSGARSSPPPLPGPAASIYTPWHPCLNENRRARSTRGGTSGCGAFGTDFASWRVARAWRCVARPSRPVRPVATLCAMSAGTRALALRRIGDPGVAGAALVSMPPRHCRRHQAQQPRAPPFAHVSERRRARASNAREGRPPSARIDRAQTPASPQQPEGPNPRLTGPAPSWMDGWKTTGLLHRDEKQK
jgi:hypothetical protein